jgi:F-type H+-transporting ATPase subunit b
MNVAQQFGIEGKLLVVQLINFAIMFFVLWKWVLPRVKGMLDERQKTIEESLKEAEKARAEKEAAEASGEKVLAEARVEADRLIKEARDEAEEERVRLVAAAKQEADQVRTRGASELSSERAKMRVELRAELAALTIASTRKVLAEVVGPTEREKLVKAAAAKLGVKKGTRGRQR